LFRQIERAERDIIGNQLLYLGDQRHHALFAAFSHDGQYIDSISARPRGGEDPVFGRLDWIPAFAEMSG